MTKRAAQWCDVLTPAPADDGSRADHRAIADLVEAVTILRRCSGAGGQRVADALLAVLFEGERFEDSFGIRPQPGSRGLHSAFRRELKQAAIRIAAADLGATSRRAAAAGVAKVIAEGGAPARMLRAVQVPASERQIQRLLSDE